MVRTRFVRACLVAALSAHAFGQSVVIPNANATVAGNAASGLPSTPVSAEFQTVYDPSQFSAGPIYITGFSFRAAPGTGPLNFTVSGNAYLSTSPHSPNSTEGPLLSTTFANNVGPDNTLVFSGSFTMSGAGCAGPAPCPFANTIVFTTPFLYNPANGSLLIDVQATAASEASGQTDKIDCNAPGCSIAAINTSPLGTPTATNVGYGGTITQFTYAPVPTGSSPVTLSGVPGGTTAAPVYLFGGSPVAQVTGTIAGSGAQDYYVFYWGGGAFSATASVTGASNAASYLFTEGSAGTCTGGASQTLNSGDSFTGTISIASLPAGEYCIGLNANNSNDPAFALSFSTPVSAAYSNAFFNGQEASTSAFSYLQFADGNPFGYYGFLAGSPSSVSAWLYHDDLGYEYVMPGAASGSVYFFDLASGHWWYTSNALFPYLYDFAFNDWLYYFPANDKPGHYTSNPRVFFNFTLNKAFTMY